MTKYKKYVRLALHLSFWGGFCLLFQIQNPLYSGKDILKLLSFIFTISFVVYFNLYFLFPRFIQKKKFKQYSLFLILLVFGSAICVTYILNDSILISNVFQNLANVLFFVMITSALKFYRDNNKMQLQIKNLENIQLSTELAILKSQINPHFLFNSLNNLYGLVLKNENEIAAQNILHLSDLMRYILESSSRKEVTLNEEIKFINNYLELEKLRLSALIDIKFETSLGNENILVPPLLFIPMIENAFKHGIVHHTTEGFAHFSLSLQGDELFFEAINSLSDFSNNEFEESKKGLENLQRRLDILYPNKHSLKIEKTNKTYTIILILNL